MMRMKYTKRFYLRMTAIMLALFMMIAGPAQAYAAEENYDQADFTEEIETLSEEEYEDFEGDFIEDEIVEEEPEIADYFEEAGEEIVEEDLIPEEEAAEAEEIIAEPLSEDDLVEVPNEDEAEKALRLLRINAQRGYPSLRDLPAEGSYSVTRSSGLVTVQNKATGTDKADYLYAALVTVEADAQKSIYALGTEIAPGKSASLSIVHNANGNKIFIDDNTEYVLWIGKADNYIDEDTGDTKYYDFKVLGYMPKYDDEGNVVTVDGVPQYEPADMVTSPVTVGSYDEYSGTWKDGYTGIKMKAVVQKNLTSVKISWALDTKNKPEQKEYKKYELFRLKADATSATGYKETSVWGPKATKTVTLKDIKVQEDSLLYLLKCYDSSDKVVAEYVTCAAPYMLEMQSGSFSGEFDFTMTARPDDSDLYMLELAVQNKEYDEKKAPKGFQQSWSTIYEIYEGFNSIESIGKYTVTKKNEPEAIQLTYNNNNPTVTLGTKYYGRVQTVKYINGLKVISAPSNVLSTKAGPPKCFVMTYAGVYYDATSAKKVSDNKYNKARASNHINAWISRVIDEYDIDTDTEKAIRFDSVDYIHNSNADVCSKSGLIYFWVDEDDIDSIKSFDLLKCDYKNGKYKKVKNYTFKNPELMECNITSQYYEESKIFAIHYNKFTPEKDAYYTVRAVSKTKNAPGGYYSGKKIKPEMDIVQGLATSDNNASSIKLSWVADDCVKQYWIYRNDSPIDVEDRQNFVQNNNPIAKVSISKAKKYSTYLTEEKDTITGKYMIYTDKKNIMVDTPYYYFVRPVYNTTKAANSSEEYMDKCSDEVKGKASALYSQISGFKAANEALEQIRVSFNTVKNIDHYRIFRLEVDSDTTKLTAKMKPDLSVLYEAAYKEKFETIEEFEDFISGRPESEWIEIISKAGADGNNWEFIKTIESNGKGGGSKSYIDANVEVGSYYFYLIQGATEKSSSILFSYTGRVRNVPQPVNSASAAYVDNGIRLTWKLNSKDESNSHLSVQVKANDRGWETASKRSYTDNNPKRGEENTYQIRVRYHNGKVDVYSPVISVKYTLPAGIEVTRASEAGKLEDNIFTIEKGQTGKLGYRAYLKNGDTASYNNISVGYDSIDSSIIKVIDRTDNSITFDALKEGETYFYLNCAGITRKITVKVVKGKN